MHGVVFGLQDKSGSLQDGAEQPDGSLRFDGEITAVNLANGGISLRGPIVHGRPGGFFLYLSSRSPGGSAAPWAFRLKVPLEGVDGTAPVLEARVRATGGGTVPLLGGGWTPPAGR
jgi:hypothetical protein